MINLGFWKKLKKPIFALAPMADVTDCAFRQIIAKYGKPDVFWTEFVAADGLAGSICARHSSSYKSVCDRLAIIGDARWARPRFWDLGMAQRARGADVALQDGARLGVSILEDIQAHATLISGGKRPLTPWMPSRLRLGFFAAQPPSFCARHSRKVVLLLLIVLVGWGRTIGEVRPCRN